MIYSMTGYGTAKGNSGRTEITIDLKSVNNRYFDCAIRIPRIYAFAEEAIKTRVQAAVARGKVDVFVTIDTSKADDVAILLNEPLLDAYLDAFGVMTEKYGIRNDVSATALGRLPDVFVIEKREVDTDAFKADLAVILEDAILKFNTMRLREGEKLREDIAARLDTIDRLTNEVQKSSPKSVELYRQKLYDRMAEVLEGVNIDESRILTEAALFADKSAIDEEITRLFSHISQFRELLNTGSGAIGRKADFIIQEMNREANTIGSKCGELDITYMSVEIKAQIEKIREQIQNIE